MKKKALILAVVLSTGITGSMVTFAKSNNTTKTAHANKANSEVMTKETDGTYVVNTTTLAKDVTNVDGVTGATFSSKAVKENVKRGLKYYMAHK